MLMRIYLVFYALNLSVFCLSPPDNIILLRAVENLNCWNEFLNNDDVIEEQL